MRPASHPAERAAEALADDVVFRLRHGVEAEPQSSSTTRSATRAAPAASDSGAIVSRLADLAVAPSADRVVGAGGGAVDGVTDALIARARGRGLTTDVRRPMERALGTDLSHVRVHDDAAAHLAGARLSARAFTVGHDIYFSQGAYRPTADPGRHLLAHELGHVITQDTHHPADAHRYLHRVVTYGQDPQVEINPGDRDLLYGINIPRGVTKGGLRPDQRDQIRTIDDYNRAIGINAVMTAANSAMGLFAVRHELDHGGAWGLHPDAIGAALVTAVTTPDIQAWTALLRTRAPWIGLKDLGSRRGFLRTDDINKKGRFKKNRKQSQANQTRADRLTPGETRNFLAPDRTQADAQVLYDAMSQSKKTALNEWVYRAFFRRTSKLGQDFALGTLNARVHFNTVADPDFQPLLGPRWQAGGVERMSATGSNAKNRSITVSELRHMNKIRGGYAANRFNVYGEI